MSKIFIEFENKIKSFESKNSYPYKSSDINDNYTKEIESTLKHNDYFSFIQKKMEFAFSLFTQDILLSIEDIVPSSNMIVEY